ncbi:acyl-CoA dehydrogenase family protein [Comamonas sp. Y33R10-2]|uniref:acyl-CoA dehydrogenase family protein n=1 Tax=Comamonas sp. Y33R10-2 TaxID=2853257 RepID=UPI001C5C8300|nr:acyl-CoA dehydrogenase family protein [Comamonas sp. Y33R10-2]QXZ10358.1 acyl-CoA dehydrogenase family protein [Comamonas sp. Y33R10-2]
MTELETFKQEVAAWLQENCPASMRRPIVSEEMVWGSSKLEFISEDQKLWFERMRDRGWFAPSWPKEYGGGGLSPKEARILETEMARLGCRQPQYNLGVWMLGPVLVEVGTHEQKLEHLVPMMRGKQRWCQGFSEPNAGSDLASLKTSAKRVTDEQGEAYIVNGGKIWTSDGDKGDWMYALVRTDSGAKKQEGISFILIDMKSPGVTVKPIELISGKSSFCQVFFDDVRVPVRQLVGKEGEGWALAKKLLQHERAAMSKFTEGGAPSHDAVKSALPYIVDEQGQVNDAVLRDKLASVLMDSQAFGLTHRRVTEKALARQDVSGPSSIMKLVQTEQEVSKYELLEQAMGLRGLGWEGDDFSADELEVCRAWLRSKSYTIAGGSSEVQLNIIAKRVLELP